MKTGRTIAELAAELDRQATAEFIAHGPVAKPAPIPFPAQPPKAKPAISGLYAVCPDRVPLA